MAGCGGAAYPHGCSVSWRVPSCCVLSAQPEWVSGGTGGSPLALLGCGGAGGAIGTARAVFRPWVNVGGVAL